MEENLPLPEVSDLLPGPHGSLGSPTPQLRLVLQPGGLVFPVHSNEVVLGRHSQCHIRLPLPDVSRQHCRIQKLNGVWILSDLDSLNGVFLNEQLVRQTELNHGDRLRIADFTFLVDLIGITLQQPVPSLADSLFQNRHRPANTLPLRRAS